MKKNKYNISERNKLRLEIKRLESKWHNFILPLITPIVTIGGIVFVFITVQTKQLDISNEQVTISKRQLALAEAQLLAFIDLKQDKDSLFLKTNGGANHSSNLRKNLIINTSVKNKKNNETMQVEYIINLINEENLEFDESTLKYDMKKFNNPEDTNAVLNFLKHSDINTYEIYEEINLTYTDKDLNFITNNWVREISDLTLLENSIFKKSEIIKPRIYRDSKHSNPNKPNEPTDDYSDRYVSITNLDLKNEYENKIEKINEAILNYNDKYYSTRN